MSTELKGGWETSVAAGLSDINRFTEYLASLDPQRQETVVFADLEETAHLYVTLANMVAGIAEDVDGTLAVVGLSDTGDYMARELITRKPANNIVQYSVDVLQHLRYSNALFIDTHLRKGHPIPNYDGIDAQVALFFGMPEQARVHAVRRQIVSPHMDLAFRRDNDEKPYLIVK